MDRYVCIHAHFYQPPRENPWLEAVEAQPSAYPYHDWNERITAECYAPNGASRIVDGRGRIAEIVNNYSRISFNFGPTLLSWMEQQAPMAYRGVLEGDRQSRQRFGGHGSALAQAYNHMILPLASRRDKETQVIWGIRDFEARFGRMPEGMWLPETAVDLETLEILEANGIRFTVLAPLQAARARRMKTGGRWKDVHGEKIDPTVPYLARLPNGRDISLFFYDGKISHAVAFEKLLNSGEQFAQRLLGGFRPESDRAQLVHIATDGESYGHHHPHGDMALAFALKAMEDSGQVRLTNYGEFLELHPPEVEVQIEENTSWSCSHGLARWYSDCGCNSGTAWRQHWRGPLRGALDWLCDTVAARSEELGADLFRDAAEARNQYVDVVLDRSPAAIDRFLLQQAAHPLSPRERLRALQFMEMQRHALLMYTSCGWFFDEVSSIEALQVMQYAARALQLAQQLSPGLDLESGFVQLLAAAPSNLAEHGDAAALFEKLVRPRMANLRTIAAHFAISAMFERGQENSVLRGYSVETKRLHTLEAGKARMAVGQAQVTSRTTTESELLTFAAVHFGDHNVTAGVGSPMQEQGFQALLAETSAAFSRADFPEVLHALERHFDGATYSLRSLLGDERSAILEMLLESTLRETEVAFRRVYESHAPLLRYLGSMGVEKPRILNITAEFGLNANLQRELGREAMDQKRIKILLDQAREERVTLDRPGLGYALQRSVTRIMEQLCDDPLNLARMRAASGAVQIAAELGLPVDLWRSQNVFYEIAQKHLSRGSRSQQWLTSFLTLGEKLNIETGQFEVKLQLAS